MPTAPPYRIPTITDYHRLTGLPRPAHPLISLVQLESMTPPATAGPVSLTFDFYCISLKRVFATQFKYGQQVGDFDDGVLFFMAPGQVIGFDPAESAAQRPTGWLLFIHPDFLWNTPLANLSQQYAYFGYSVREALYLSEKEEAQLTGLTRHIEQEYQANLDKFSHHLIISQLGTLCQYAERFYERQFITRRLPNHHILSQVEMLMTSYFADASSRRKGLPTVGYLAEKLNVSPDYLSGLLKTLTGLNAQQHIHEKLLEKAKAQLSTTSLSVSEIAYQLGFEHSQSFNKLFKAKTSLSPLEFRQSFN